MHEHSGGPILAHAARSACPVLLGVATFTLLLTTPLGVANALVVVVLVAACILNSLQINTTRRSGVVLTGLCFAMLLVLDAFVWRATDGSSATTFDVVVLGPCAALFCMIWLAARRGWVVVLCGFALCLALVLALYGGAPDIGNRVLGVSASWALALSLSLAFLVLVPRSLSEVDALAQSFATERHETELEAERRASARLLHDTVLATLTLLAHGGEGTDATQLRAAARRDAQLLARLRRGEHLELAPTVTVESGAIAWRDGIDEFAIEHGVTISSLGDPVALPEPAFDDVVLAIRECVSNVARHAGVAEASITTSETEDTAHGIVADRGVGFDPDHVDRRRLGFAESVVGRMHAHGGTARVFSRPGSGTTVIMQVPKL